MKTIKTLVENEDLRGLSNLFEGELDNAPSRKHFKNENFYKIFTKEWKREIK